jgi:hypothetical protein
VDWLLQVLNVESRRTLFLFFYLFFVFSRALERYNTVFDIKKTRPRTLKLLLSFPERRVRARALALPRSRARSTLFRLLATIQHNVWLWAMNRVMHPSSALLYAQTAPFRLRNARRARVSQGDDPLARRAQKHLE